MVRYLKGSIYFLIRIRNDFENMIEDKIYATNWLKADQYLAGLHKNNKIKKYNRPNKDIRTNIYIIPNYIIVLIHLL